MYRLVLLGIASLLFGGAVRGAPVVGEPAPALSGTYFDGDEFDLARMRGKVVLVNYYSSYCKVCALEIGTLETVQEELRGRGLEVLMLGVDDTVNDRERVARMLDIYNLRGAMIGGLRENEFGLRYPTPTAFIIDRRGTVRAKKWGAIPLSSLRQQLTLLLDQP